MSNSGDRIDRRRFIGTLGMGPLILPSFVRAAGSSKSAGNKPQLLYVGTYTSATASEGIYVYTLDSGTGSLSQIKIVPNVKDPSFLVTDPKFRFLYAVNETLQHDGLNGGSVSSFSIDRRSGDLKFLNAQPSMGGAPCYLSTSKNGRYVLVANYKDGNITVLPTGPDGRLNAAIQTIQQSGNGPNKERQESAHAHWIDFHIGGKIVAACDLGSDKVFLYRFDERTGKLTRNGFFATRPGAGPRHLAFHPGGKFAFLISELNSTISSLVFDEQHAQFRETESVSTLPQDWTGENSCAEIQISPDGRFLYGSNRGHDSIVSYQIDPAAGKLSLIEHVSTSGKAPRHFTIDPTGNVLLAANQRSDSIVSFFMDAKTGKLHPTGNKYDVPSPVCLKLIPAGN